MAVQELTDEKLFMRYVKTSDSSAFEILLNRYQNQVFGYLMRSCRNRSTAEDLYQETFMRVIRAANSYQPRAKFRTWLFTIVRHLVIDAKRRKDTQGDSISLGPEKNVDRAPVQLAANDQNDPYVAEKARELRTVIHAGLAELPEEQREMFLLREQAGLNFKEAAQAAGCSVNTAKSRMRYALLKLRKDIILAGLHAQEPSIP